MGHQCLACGGDQPKSGYNTAQWKKGPGLGRCKACFAAAASASPPQLPPIRQRQHVDVRADLTHREFVERYKHKRPVILRGLANDWAALARWGNVEHLSSLHDKDILVLRSPDGRHFLKRTCEHYWGPFGDVAERLFTPGGLPPGERLYARARLEDGLREEVALEALELLVGGAPGAHSFNVAKCGVWLGSTGCVTPLHYDLCHGFLVGVLGTKHFTYYPPEAFRDLYPRDASHGMELGEALLQDIEQAAQLSEQIDTWRDAKRQRALAAAEAGEGGLASAVVGEGGLAGAVVGAETTMSETITSAAEAAAWHAEVRPSAVVGAEAIMSAAEAAAWHAEVRPGDVLYTPPYHWHHVETGHESSALSVLVPWDPTAEEPAPACMLGIVKPE
jgi:uncharacterized RmlC-like cupin family protein